MEYDDLTFERVAELEACVEAGDALATRDARALLAMARRLKKLEHEPPFEKLAAAMAGSFPHPSKVKLRR